MDYREDIVRDHRICVGVPVVKGTRIPVKTILASLAAGDKIEDLLASFPTLTEEAVWAVIAFAATSFSNTGATHPARNNPIPI
jgi:uncharacterized protein (DUF433 family)